MTSPSSMGGDPSPVKSAVPILEPRYRLREDSCHMTTVPGQLFAIRRTDIGRARSHDPAAAGACTNHSGPAARCWQPGRLL